MTESFEFAIILKSGIEESVLKNVGLSVFWGEASNMMIDFHTHILPNMDDGSHSLEQTYSMLKREHEQGIQKIIATPHFYANKDFMDSFLVCRQKQMQAVKEMLDQKGWEDPPDLYAGAEVYYFQGMGRASTISRLCIEGTSVLMVELPFAQWRKDVYQDVKQLVDEQNLTVILAHIERYYPYQKKKDVWNAVFELPVYAQMNAEAFLTWKERLTGMKLLKRNYQFLLGSDCHDMERRSPDLAEGRKAIKERVGEEFLRRIDENGRKVMGL